MYKLVFYVPVDHLEPVKQAVFATGAGKIGEYDSCCWQVLGVGQFRPLAGSTPYLGMVLTPTKSPLTTYGSWRSSTSNLQRC